MRLPMDDYPWPEPPLRVKRPAIEWVIVFENSSTQVFRFSYICFHLSTISTRPAPLAGWVGGPTIKALMAHLKTLKDEPPIKEATPDSLRAKGGFGNERSMSTWRKPAGRELSQTCFPLVEQLMVLGRG